MRAYLPADRYLSRVRGVDQAYLSRCAYLPADAISRFRGVDQADRYLSRCGISQGRVDRADRYLSRCGISQGRVDRADRYLSRCGRADRYLSSVASAVSTRSRLLSLRG